MPIILSQRVDRESDYEDIPFVIYHYPKRYRNQIQTGDSFVYYQGNKSKKEQRYYFGTGIIGGIDVSSDGEDFYAHVVQGVKFKMTVPIYRPGGGYLESLSYQSVRNSENPPWQQSVRPLSQGAYDAILNEAGCVAAFDNTEAIERCTDALSALVLLNEKYGSLAPQKRDMEISRHLDRGGSVVKALKHILGSRCQVCGTLGFEKSNGGRYIEAHHLTLISLQAQQSLCSDNIILLCSNCHRELHYGRDVTVTDLGQSIGITMGSLKRSVEIRKNTIAYLSGVKHQT